MRSSHLKPALFATALALAALTVLMLRPRGRSGLPSAAVLPRRIAEVPPVFRLACRTVDTADGRAPFPEFALEQTPAADGRVPYAVHCPGGVDGSLRARAEALGATVLGYIPDDQIAVLVTREAYGRLAADAAFAAAVELGPADKIHPELPAKCVPGAVVPVTVVVHRPDYFAFASDFVLAGGGTRHEQMLAPDATSFAADVPADLVAALATHAEIDWIEPWHPARPCNDQAVTHMNVTPVWGDSRPYSPVGDRTALNLTGDGVIISTSDTGCGSGILNDMHADLNGQLCGLQTVSGANDKDIYGHGTHTAGSIVGNGRNSGGKYKGTAHGAKLFVWQCGSGSEGKTINAPNDLNKRYLGPDGTLKASIHSASWSNASWGQYGSDAQAIDRWCWNHPTFLPVRSAGNDGNLHGGTHEATTICTPSTAKNILCVGASEDERALPYTNYVVYKDYHGRDQGKCDHAAEVWDNSSCGPTGDGRIKPDVVAPGSYVISTKSGHASGQDTIDTYYAFKSGTSMATPLTAGACALVREWLVKYRGFASEGPTEPTAAMLKAVVIGGATDLFRQSNNNALSNAPDGRQGFGRVNVAGSVAPDGRRVFLKDRLPFARNGTNEFTFATTTTQDLDVALVWIDHPSAQMYNAKTLVNDLDVSVVRHSDGRIFYPNGLSEPDRVNNVEKMHFTSLAPGTYTVRVTCPTVPYDSTQGGAAALYFSGAFDENAVQYRSTLEARPLKMLVR